MRCACLTSLLLLHAAPVAAEQASAALLVALEPGPDPVQLAGLRDQLGRRFHLLDAEHLRKLLERFDRRLPAEELIRDRLRRTREALRRSEPEAARTLLAEATAAAAELSPTAEARALSAELAVRRAMLAQLLKDERGFHNELRCALTVEPELQLSPALYPPPVAQALEEARVMQAHARRITIDVRSVPDRARVMVGGVDRGATPLQLTEVSVGPTVIWVYKDGHQSRAVTIDTASATHFEVTLQPLDPISSMRYLVQAVRRSDPASRQLAALALAAALKVDAIVVVSSPDVRDAEIIGVPKPPPPPARGPVWWQDRAGGALLGCGLALFAGGLGMLGWAAPVVGDTLTS